MDRRQRTVTTCRSVASLPTRALDLAEAVAPTSNGLNVAFHVSCPIVLFSREDNGIHAVDIRTAMRVGMPALGHTEFVRCAVAGQVDHRTVVASIAYDETVRIVDLATGTPLGTPFSIQSRYPEMGVQFTFGQVDGVPVGFTCSLDEVRMWDLRSMRPIGEPLCGADHDVSGLAIMPAPAAIPGPPLVVTGGFKGALRVHSLSAGRQVAPHCTSSLYTFAMAAAAVDGNIIAAQGGWRVVHVWNVGTQQRIGTLRGPDAIRCLLTCKLDDRWVLISTFEDSTLRVWDLITQVPVGAPLTGHTAKVTDLATSDGKDLLVSTSDDGTARIWDLRTHQAVGDPLGDHQLGAKTVSLGRLDNRDIVVTGDGGGHIRAWDLLTRKVLMLDIPPHADAIARLRIRKLHNAPILVAADKNGRIRVWNLSTRSKAHGDQCGKQRPGHSPNRQRRAVCGHGYGHCNAETETRARQRLTFEEIEISNDGLDFDPAVWRAVFRNSLGTKSTGYSTDVASRHLRSDVLPSAASLACPRPFPSLRAGQTVFTDARLAVAWRLSSPISLRSPPGDSALRALRRVPIARACQGSSDSGSKLTAYRLPWTRRNRASSSLILATLSDTIPASAAHPLQRCRL